MASFLEEDGSSCARTRLSFVVASAVSGETLGRAAIAKLLLLEEDEWSAVLFSERKTEKKSFRKMYENCDCLFGRLR